MLSIKVLGSGCANCKRVEAVTRQAATEMGVEANLVKVTDYSEIMEYGILSTPGLVIEDKVVCSGRIPSQAEITKWLEAALHN